MKNNRCKLRNGRWIPQSRFKLLWFIPTPIWLGFWNEYGDGIFGGASFEPLYFHSEEDCMHWFDDNGLRL